MNDNVLWQLFSVNFKMLYRDRSGIFWTILMPAFIYIALSIIPIGRLIETDTSYPNFLLPGVIAMSIMQGGIYGLAYLIVDLKSQGVLKRFLATPLKNWQFIFGAVSSRLAIMFIQVIILTLLGITGFHVSFQGNITAIIVLLILGGSLFLLVGLLIANFAHSYNSAAPITTAIGLPLAALGNIFFPVAILPNFLQAIVKILPITYLAEGLRQAYLYPFSFQVISKDIVVLAIWLGILLIFTLSVFKLKED